MAQGTNGQATVQATEPAGITLTQERLEAMLRAAAAEGAAAVQAGSVQTPTRTVILGLPQVVDALAGAAAAGAWWFKANRTFSSGSRGHQAGGKLTIGGIEYQCNLLMTEIGSKPSA